MKHTMRERLIGAGILIFLAIVFIPLFLGNKLDDLPLVQPEQIPAKPSSLQVEVNPFTQPPDVYEIGDDYLDKEMHLEENSVADAKQKFEENLPVKTNTLSKEQYEADSSKRQLALAKAEQEKQEKQGKSAQTQEQVEPIKPNLSLSAIEDLSKTANSGTKSSSDAQKTKTANSSSSKQSNTTQTQKQGGGKMWAIQVASFSDSTKAREFLGKLEKQGFEGYWRIINKLSVVFAGPYTNSDIAQTNLKKLTAKFKGKYLVVKYVNEFTAEKFGTLPPKNIRSSIK